MKRALRRFSAVNRRSGLSADWRSVLSIGDCQAERLALQDVIMAGGAQSHCKTVKFIDAPCLDVLLAQLQILVAWLERLATHDGDVDLSFDSLATEGNLCDLLP
jgi:hypothetical protein